MWKLYEIQISVSISKVLLETVNLIYLLSMAPFSLQQSWVVATETTWLMKPKIFTVWPFTEKVC